MRLLSWKPKPMTQSAFSLEPPMLSAMSSTPILTLPSELICSILQIVHNVKIGSLAMCLRVCKSWHDIGRPLLCRDIYVQLKDFEGIERAVPVYDLDKIMSVTTHLVFDSSQKDRAGELWPTLDALSAYLTTMPNLATLSLTFLECPASDDSSFQGLARLLHKFPTSVRNLDLCCDAVLTIITEDGHICGLLADILPQLERLHIAGTLVCPELFNNITRKCFMLTEIVIDCTDLRSAPDCVAWRRPARHEGDTADSVVMPFIDAINDVLHKGLMPKITCLILIGKREFPFRPAHPLAFDCMYKIDFMQNETTVYPFQWLWSQGSNGPGEVNSGRWMRYIDPITGNNVDVAGDFNQSRDFGKILEGWRWCKSVHGPSPRWNSYGARLPLSFQKHRHYAWDGPVKLSKLGDPARSYRARFSPGSRLWYWEDVVGRTLLSAKAIRGCVVPKFPRREQPLEELEMDPTSAKAQELRDLGLF